MIAHIVLFDIDGTLISSSAAEEDERRRYLKTIHDVVGMEPSVIPSRFAGMVDPQICKILLAETCLDDEKVEYFLPKVLTQPHSEAQNSQQTHCKSNANGPQIKSHPNN